MNGFDYGSIIITSWLVLVTVWVLGAFAAKRDAIGKPGIILWLSRLLLLGLLVFALLQSPRDDVLILEQRFFNFGVAVNWIAGFLTIVGIAFAIWARFRLGRDWGSNTKENPVLVTSGPYAYVRHPIYAGAVLGLFGSALTGSMVAVVLFVISVVFCVRRMQKEECVMQSLFPIQYSVYQGSTKRFIPFVW